MGSCSFRKPEHRRRWAGIAAAGVLRDRAPARRSQSVRCAHRVCRRGLLCDHRPDVYRTRPGDGPRFRRGPKPRGRLLRRHPGQSRRDHRFYRGLVLPGGSRCLVCHRPGGGLPGLAQDLAASAIRPAGIAGADRLGGDPRRGTFLDFLVALLSGHLPSAQRHD